MTLDLVGTEYLADICGKSRRTAEGYLLSVNGHPPVIEPEVVVSGRPLWRRTAVERWCAAGRPAGRFAEFTDGLDPIPALCGIEDVADRCGVQIKTVRQWRFRDQRRASSQRKLPEPDLEVAGVLVWTADRIASWNCGST